MLSLNLTGQWANQVLSVVCQAGNFGGLSDWFASHILLLKGKYES